jgi:hypothetical protein
MTQELVKTSFNKFKYGKIIFAVMFFGKNGVLFSPDFLERL